MSYRFTTGGTVTHASQYADINVKRLNQANRLALDYQVSERRFELFKIDGGAKSVLAVGGQGPPVGPNQSYWLRAATDRDAVVGEVFTSDPYALPPPDPAGRFR